jgi:hypothetical protein
MPYIMRGPLWLVTMVWDLDAGNAGHTGYTRVIAYYRDSGTALAYIDMNSSIHTKV